MVDKIAYHLKQIESAHAILFSSNISIFRPVSISVTSRLDCIHEKFMSGMGMV